MGVFSDNFYSWLDRQFSRTAEDEESMSDHDKHYHPDGFNPKTDNCNRREKEKDTDSVEKNSPLFTEDTLKSRFGMKVQPFSIDINGKDAQHFTTQAFRDEWKDLAREPNEADRRKVLNLVGRTLSEIEDRFGCHLHIDNLLIAEYLPYKGDFVVGGASLADKIAVKESIMAITTNGLRELGEERKIRDIRHELGHILTTQDVVDKFYSKIEALTQQFGIKGVRMLLKHCTSEYAYEMKMDYEYIAEIFERLTSPKSKPIFMPKEFQSLVIDDMLGGEK